MFWDTNTQFSLLINYLPFNNTLTLILAFLCWFGTVYVFSVPLYHLVFDKNKEDKIYAIKILGLLIAMFFILRFFEKRY